jgi:endophilin-B
VRCGQTQQKLGQARRQFIETTATDLLQPFNAFLEGDMKTIQVNQFELCS